MPNIKGCQKVFKQQAQNEQQTALELAPKAQVLECRGIQGHFENCSLGNGVPRGFQEVFSTVDAMLFRPNTRQTGNNAIEMSQAFQDIAQFERVTDLNLLEYAFNVIQNWETDALQLFLFDDAYFLLAVTVDKEMKVADQGWLTSRRFWPATGPY